MYIINHIYLKKIYKISYLDPVHYILYHTTVGCKSIHPPGDSPIELHNKTCSKNHTVVHQILWYGNNIAKVTRFTYLTILCETGRSLRQLPFILHIEYKWSISIHPPPPCYSNGGRGWILMLHLYSICKLKGSCLRDLPVSHNIVKYVNCVTFAMLLPYHNIWRTMVWFFQHFLIWSLMGESPGGWILLQPTV